MAKSAVRPLRAVLAENGDAVAFADAPFLQCVDGSGNVAAKIRGRDGQPFSGLAGEHHAVEIPLGGGEENIVQRSESHGARGIGLQLQCTVLRLPSAMRNGELFAALGWTAEAAVPNEHLRF